MSDDLDVRATQSRNDLTRAVDEAAAPAPPAAGVARRAARRRASRGAMAVIAVFCVGTVALWPKTDDESPSKVVAGQPETSEQSTSSSAGNRCFRPTYLPAGFAPELLPGPGLAGGPAIGPRDEVYHWGEAPDGFIDVNVADTASPLLGGDAHFRVLGGDATAGTIADSGGGRHEFVAFPACGRWWFLNANTAGGHPGPGDVRRVAEGLVAGDPNHRDPTGVAGSLHAYSPPPSDPETPIPVHGPVPGSGPSAGRVVAVANGAEVARVDVPPNGRFTLTLPAGEYDIVATLDNDRECGQQHVTVVQGRVRTLTFSCMR